MKEVIGTEILHAVEGKIDLLKQALQEIVSKSRLSEGCLQYDLFEPIGERGKFLIFMRWKNVEALREHENSKYVQEFVKKYDQIAYGDVFMSEWARV